MRACATSAGAGLALVRPPRPGRLYRLSTWLGGFILLSHLSFFLFFPPVFMCLCFVFRLGWESVGFSCSL